MKVSKHSHQRDMILAELCSRKDHPTAEELYLALKPTLPALSLATVYRNLSQLAQEEKVLKINVDGTVHFDGNAQNHYHLTCLICGRVDDIEVLPDDELNHLAQSVYDGKVISHSVMFMGICKECLDNNRN